MKNVSKFVNSLLVWVIVVCLVILFLILFLLEEGSWYLVAGVKAQIVIICGAARYRFRSIREYIEDRLSWQQIDLDFLPRLADRRMEPDARRVCNAVITDCFCVMMQREKQQRDGLYKGREVSLQGSHPYKERRFAYYIVVDGRGMLEVSLLSPYDGKLKNQVRTELRKSYRKRLVDMPQYQEG